MLNYQGSARNLNDSAGRAEVWSVSRLNERVRDVLQNDGKIQNILLEGEIFNLKKHDSGHIYFSLKDRNSLINCTFFRGSNARQKDLVLKDGMQVVARGGISVFAPRGNYQFNIYSLSPSGEGELRLRIEELRKKLFKEGLFDPGKKKEIPSLPLTIGVATSPTGAALQDVIRVARSRFPGISILLAPCLVQGEGASETIVEAIKALNNPVWDVDVIIAGRGGGSFEDLLAYSDESVVRAFASSDVPIISAVGHEIDHPLSDLAADAYAATPSAAAEKVVPVYALLLESLNEFGFRLDYALKNRHRTDKERLVRIFKSRVFQRPESLFLTASQRLDQSVREISDRMRERIRSSSISLMAFRSFDMLFEKNILRGKSRFHLASERLENFSPLATLKRGYSVVRNVSSQVIRSTQQVKAGENLEVILSDGRLNVRVIDT